MRENNIQEVKTTTVASLMRSIFILVFAFGARAQGMFEALRIMLTITVDAQLSFFLALVSTVSPIVQLKAESGATDCCLR